MMASEIKTQSGFTLLETLVYLALFSIVVTGSILATIAVVSVSDTTQAETILQQDTDFISRKMRAEFMTATAITVPSVGATSSALSLMTPLGSVSFDVSASSTRIRRGAGAWSNLNSSNVQVGGLVFEHLAPAASKPEGLKISFEARDSYRGLEPVSETFYFQR